MYNKKVKKILKYLFAFALLLILFIIISNYINSNRKPDHNTTLSSSFLSDFIISQPQNIIYIRDMELFLKYGKENELLMKLWNIYFDRAYNHLNTRIRRRIPFFDIRRSLMGLFGSELLVYSDNNGDIYLISRMKFMNQIAIHTLLKGIQIFSKDAVYDNYFRMTINSENISDIFIRPKGSILFIATNNDPLNDFEGFDHDHNYNQIPDFMAYLPNIEYFSDYIDLGESLLVESFYKILLDRRINLITAHFEQDDFFLGLFSSSKAYNNELIWDTMSNLQNMDLDDYPLFFHANTPKSIKIENNRIYYNEIYISDINAIDDPLHIYSPFNLLLASPETKGGIPVIYAETAKIEGDTSFLYNMVSGLRPPFNFYIREGIDSFEIKNRRDFEVIETDINSKYFFRDNIERVYLYMDLYELLSSLRPVILLISVMEPRLSALGDLTDKLTAQNKTAKISLFSSKYQTLFLLYTKDL